MALTGLTSGRNTKQDRCMREITWHQTADQSYLGEGARLLELAHNAQRLFVKQEPREKRRLLKFMVSNCTWMHGELSATFRQPFDLLAETALMASQESARQGTNPARRPIWLLGLDSNQRPFD